MRINREHKDRLFKFIFEKKENLLELYNALNGTNYNKVLSIEEAVDRATDECIEEGILKEILIEHRAEVKDMLLTEYDEEKTMRLFQKEYEEEAAEKIARAEAEVVKAKEEVIKAEEKATKAEEKLAKAEEQAAKAEEQAAKARKQVEDMEKVMKQMQMEMKELREKMGYQ